MPDYDLTFYAVWEQVCNIIKFDMNGVDVWTIPEDVYCWSDYPGLLPNRIVSIDGDVALAGWSRSRDGSMGKSYGRGDFIYAITPFEEAEVPLYAQWKPRDGFGVTDAMYMFTGQVFGLDENGTVTDAVYDSSVSGDDKPELYPTDFTYFRVKKTGDNDNPFALYLYEGDAIYDPDRDFSGYPLVPYGEDDPDNPYGTPAPEGSLIGSGNNDGLTQQCKTMLQYKYGRDWAKGLVTVGNITMLWEDSRYPDGHPDYNPGFVFTSVNGVRYFISGRTSYSYGMEYQYDVIDFGYDIIDFNPTMEEIDAIDYYYPGPTSSLG